MYLILECVVGNVYWCVGCLYSYGKDPNAVYIDNCAISLLATSSLVWLAANKDWQAINL